eukprot:5791268-Amphidinium_carterae.1
MAVGPTDATAEYCSPRIRPHLNLTCKPAATVNLSWCVPYLLCLKISTFSSRELSAGLPASRVTSSSSSYLQQHSSLRSSPLSLQGVLRLPCLRATLAHCPVGVSSGT